MNQKVIAKVGLTRIIVDVFAFEVNQMIDSGYKLTDFKVEKHWFTFVCTAVLEQV